MRKLLSALLVLGFCTALLANPQPIYELDANRGIVKADSTAPVHYQHYDQYLFFANGTANLSLPKSERYAFGSNDIWRLDTKTNIVVRIVGDNSYTEKTSRPYYVANNWILYFTYSKGLVIADLDGKILHELPSLRNSDVMNEADKMSLVGGYVYFPAINNKTQKTGLWRSNGTAEGTEEVTLCTGTTCYAAPQNFQTSANKLFFIATAADGKHALWTINSQNKAVMFQAASPEINSGERLKPYRDGVVLQTKTELWYADGTEEGSYAIKQPLNNNIVQAVASDGDNMLIATTDLFVIPQHGKGAGKKVEMGLLSNPRNFTVLQDKIFFTVTLKTANGQRLHDKLMQLDGTNKPIEVYAFENARFFDHKIMGSKGNKLLLLRYKYDLISPEVPTAELWVSDGTKAGTAKISDAGVPHPLWEKNSWAFVQDALYFSGYSELTGLELWRSDSTAPGTVLSKDLGFGLPKAHIGQMVANGSSVFHLLDHQWYKSTGSTQGNMRDVQLWKTDASNLRSSFIAEWPEFDIDFTRPMIVSGNGVYLWVSNKEQAATYDLMFYHQQNGTFSKVLGAVEQSCENNRPHRFQEQSIGNLFYFQAPVGTIYDYSCQLWVSDGTVAGTKAITSFAKTIFNTSLINQTAQLHNELYFTLDVFGTDTPELTTQVFKTDGTAAGTKVVFSVPKDPESTVTSISQLSANAAGVFVVTASLQQQQTRQQLWYWDQQQLTALSELTDVYDFVRFSDGIAYISGGSIYRSNGTAAGTGLLLKLPPPTGPNEGFNHLTVTPDFRYLFFSGKDDSDKIRLWRSDGSGAGTVVIGQPLSAFNFALHAQVGQDVYLTTYHSISNLNYVEQLSRYSLTDTTAVDIYSQRIADLNNLLPVVAAQGRIFIGSKLQLPSFGGPYVTANLDDGDFDKDGVLNKDDVFPLHPDEFADFDGDRLGDNADPDDDNDEAVDTADLFLKNALEWRDQDQDKTGDNADNDDDNDGVTDWLDAYPHDASRHTNQVSNPGTGTTEPTQPTKPVTESSSGGAVHFWLLLCGLALAARRRC